jgi:ferritin
MVSKKMEKALNEHLNEELFSAYYYVAIAAHFEDQNLNGFAHWMKQQASEEIAHATKFYNFINDVGGRVVLEAVAKPPKDFKKPINAFETALGHERKVTQRINKLVDMALKESDHATHQFLQWFVTEQVEEESTAETICQQLRLVGDNPNGLFLMDRELAARAAEPSAE